jgi:hypothetical protein
MLIWKSDSTEVACVTEDHYNGARIYTFRIRPEIIGPMDYKGDEWVQQTLKAQSNVANERGALAKSVIKCWKGCGAVSAPEAF